MTMTHPTKYSLKSSNFLELQLITFVSKSDTIKQSHYIK